MADYHVRESEWNEIKQDVKKILVNHLPHINVNIGKLQTRVTIFGGIIMLLLAGLIAEIYAFLSVAP